MSKLVFTILLVIGSLSTIAQKYVVDKIETELKSSVFAPAYWKNKLVVCCNQKDRINKTVLDKFGQEPIDLYVINPLNPEPPSRFDEKFRTLYHDGPASYNGPGDYLSVSRNLKTDQKYKSLVKEENHLGLYFSAFDGEGWSDLESFPYNDTAYNCSHPCLNYDGFTLYFASDMPGGFGGYDLWKSNLVSGEWQKPVNLGPTINSEKDELFPYVYGFKLYFSSDRGVFGGLDLYQASLINDDYETKVLDKGLNGSSDDFGLITSNALESGFLSSNRSGVDQVYSFYFEYPDFNACDSIVETTMCYELKEQNYFETDGPQPLIYEWHINTDTVQGAAIDYCFPSPGDYEITLDVIDTVIHKTYYEQSYYYLSIELEVQPYIDAPDTVRINELFQLSAINSHLPEMTIDDENFYWYLDDGTKYRGETAIHKFKQAGIYQIKLGVIGDSDGEEERDCAYRSIICVDENGNYLNLNQFAPDTSGLSLLRSESNDMEIFLYAVEIEKSTKEPTQEQYNWALIDPLNQYDLHVLEEDEGFVSVMGTFKDSADAYKFLYKLLQLGYEDAKLRKIALDELENFNLSVEEFFDSYNDYVKASPDLFGDNDNVSLSEVKHYYTDPSDTNLVVFSIEVIRSKDTLPSDHFIYSLIPPYSQYQLKYLEEEDEYIYLFGSFERFDEAYKYFLELQQFGLENAILRSFNVDDFSDFELNQSFSFNNIQFDSDKWSIRPDAEIEIKKILDVMNFFPTLQIDISAHTDATASEHYNLSLSNKRARSVRDYLIKFGISSERITYKGFGEAKPIDTNETEEGKQNNRRVEFVLTKS